MDKVNACRETDRIRQNAIEGQPLRHASVESDNVNRRSRVSGKMQPAPGCDGFE
jgi:hypothetical protein